MRKGFTMIELIFVIVILGILAAVAIPRLAATRDDAEVSKAATNVATVVADVTSYYTAQGEFNADLQKMTNVPLSQATGQTASIKIKNADCITFEVQAAAATADTAKGVKVGDPVLLIKEETSNTEAACTGVKSAVKKIVESSPIRLGGSGVKFN
ncbi:MAG: type II secretion system protein [Campylobacter sp.]